MPSNHGRIWRKYKSWQLLLRGVTLVVTREGNAILLSVRTTRRKPRRLARRRNEMSEAEGVVRVYGGFGEFQHGLPSHIIKMMSPDDSPSLEEPKAKKKDPPKGTNNGQT
jgi:hypothetical protein